MDTTILPPPSDLAGSRYDMSRVAEEKTRNMTPSVKLPGISMKAGPGSRSEAQSKEVSRRQGSNNSTDFESRGRSENGKTRGQKRGGRGRKPRGGAERVDGGIVVKS